MGTPLPLPKKAAEPLPQFSAHFHCGRTAECIKVPLGIEVGLSPGDFVRWGPSPLPKKGAQPPPQFSVHVHCDQMAGWIKVALGTEVGLGPRHIVLDGDPALLLKKTAEAPLIFGPLLLWPNGWMHQDASWYGGRPQPRRLCVRWGPSPPPQKGVEPIIFGPCPTSIVAKRLHGLRCRLIWR